MHRDKAGGPATKDVGGYSYTPSCTMHGSGKSLVVTTQVVVSQLDGQTYNLYGLIHSQSNDTGPITTITDN